MNILDILRNAEGGGAAKTLAQTFGISPAEADAVLQSVIPQLSQRIERNTLSRGGVADLVGAIGRASSRDVLAHPQSLASDAVQQDGIAFLDQILWSKDKSRSVAHAAAQSTGLSEALIKQMLPSIAAMMMGGLAKGAAGGLGDILSKIPGLPGGELPGGDDRQAGADRYGDSSRQGPSGGGGSWDSGSGGRPAPGGRDFSGQSPLPIPGDAPRGGGGGRSAPNPFDDLSDIIRRGGQPAPGGGGSGGGLSNIIRTILGAILGFQSRGLLSWIIRYVVVRYGASIVRAVLSILLGRRA